MTQIFSWSSILQKACRLLIHFLVHRNLLELKSDSPSLFKKITFYGYVDRLQWKFLPPIIPLNFVMWFILRKIFYTALKLAQLWSLKVQLLIVFPNLHKRERTLPDFAEDWPWGHSTGCSSSNKWINTNISTLHFAASWGNWTYHNKKA